jgi:hypothetical protein
MNTQKEFTKRGGRRGWTQAQRIRRRLTVARGAWVPMFTLARVGAGDPQGFCMVHSRVADLRRAGLVVEQRSEWEGGRCKSFYRLVEK